MPRKPAERAAVSNPTAGVNEAKLRYTPPTLTAPTEAEVTAGSGFYVKDFGGGDGILKFPASTKTGKVEVTGVKNLRIIGGALKPASGTGSALRIKPLNGGTVYIEGMLIDCNSLEMDCLDIGIAAEKTGADYYIQNCRFQGVKGSAAGTHSDLIQPQATIKSLFMDKFTGYSQYQGLFFPPQNPITSVALKRVNLGYIAGGDPTTYLLWFASASQTPYPALLENVWVTPREGQTLVQSAIWPKAGEVNGAGELIGAETKDEGETAYWPAIEKVEGVVRKGPRIEGDFVKESSVGLGYVSPGYV